MRQSKLSKILAIALGLILLFPLPLGKLVSDSNITVASITA